MTTLRCSMGSTALTATRSKGNNTDVWHGGCLLTHTATDRLPVRHRQKHGMGITSLLRQNHAVGSNTRAISSTRSSEHGTLSLTRTHQCRTALGAHDLLQRLVGRGLVTAAPHLFAQNIGVPSNTHTHTHRHRHRHRHRHNHTPPHHTHIATHTNRSITLSTDDGRSPADDMAMDHQPHLLQPSPAELLPTPGGTAAPFVGSHSLASPK